MKKKLKALCSSFPKVARPQSPLDNIAATIFRHDGNHDYIQSGSAPERRYAIDIDASLLRYHNQAIEEFHNFGPNEQYLINKILFSPSKLLYIVGGIGVGKTTFSRFFMKNVLPKLAHLDSHDRSRCPCAIYLDFLDFGEDTFTKKDFTEIGLAFTDILCDRIEGELADKNFFDIEQEVVTVWEDILERQGRTHEKNAAFSFILARLREEEAGSSELENDPFETIAKRKKIRREIKTNKVLRRVYLAILLDYIKRSFYADHPYCILLIVDNIDREPPLVQRAVNLALKPFAKNGGIRIVVNARQTTFYQGRDDGLSEPLDFAAYCGPNPIELVYARLSEFFLNNEVYKNSYSQLDLLSLTDGMKEIRENYLKREAFVSFFQSVCGHSVRKGLILAQNLINNSVYDPCEAGKQSSGKSSLGFGDVLRATIVGASDTFTYSPNDLIENVFQVQRQSRDSYLIKLRILKAMLLTGDAGIRINRLIGILAGFGHGADLLVDALHELMIKPKRLVWSDSVRDFESPEDLAGHGNTYLYLTSIGDGYARHLYKRLEYIQEIMLDTFVDEDEFGKGWDYGKIEHRLKLVGLFCGALYSRDETETQKFVGDYGPNEYLNIFGGEELVSREITESVAHDVERILDFVIGHSQGPQRENLIAFSSDQLAFYSDYNIRARNLEATLFGINH